MTALLDALCLWVVLVSWGAQVVVPWRQGGGGPAGRLGRLWSVPLVEPPVVPVREQPMQQVEGEKRRAQPRAHHHRVS